MEYTIKPLVGVNEFIFKETRNIILSKDNTLINKTFVEQEGNNSFIVDDYGDFLAYYNQKNKKLFYMTFIPLPTVKLFFAGKDLFLMNSYEIYDLLSVYDSNMFVEDYVGFGSTSLGIDIYSPNFIEDKNAKCEGISIAVQGYFDSIYRGEKLDVNKLTQDVY